MTNEIKKLEISDTGSKRSILLSIRQLFKVIILAILIILPIRYYIAEPFFVRGPSMAPNFKNGDYLLIDEFSYHFGTPQKGDVVVFRYPPDPSQFFIKRIIGLPYETVVVNNNSVIIFNPDNPNGVLLKENYLDISQVTLGNMTTKLGDNQYFVLGDNRLNSSDSRQWGILDRKLIDGKAVMRLWPLNRLQFIRKEI